MKRLFFLFALFALLFLLVPHLALAQLTRGDDVQLSILGSTNPAASGASGTVTQRITGDTISRMQNFRDGVFTLNVTTLSGVPSDTLSVWIQHTADGGTTWTDLLRFGNIAGTDSVANSKRFAYWSSRLAPGPWVSSLVADVERQIEDRSIAAGTVNQGPIGSQLRVAYNYNSVTASFTFSITGFFHNH